MRRGQAFFAGTVRHADQSDWYLHPLYYDIVFDDGTREESDFLEAVLEHYGPGKPRKNRTILEPASGSGRLVSKLARRGHRVDGFDISLPMVRYSRMRARELPASSRDRVTFRNSRMQSFRAPPGLHWFSYYDKIQFDPTDRYVLGMRADFDNRPPTEDDVIAIGMIALADGNKWNQARRIPRMVLATGMYAPVAPWLGPLSRL